MPPIPGAEGAFYAAPGSQEIIDLDERWKKGDFIARVTGSLMLGDVEQPATVFVPDGEDPRLVVRLLMMMDHESPVTGYIGSDVAWRE